MSTKLTQAELDTILEQIRLSEERQRSAEAKHGSESQHQSAAFDVRGQDRKRRTEENTQNDAEIARLLAEQDNPKPKAMPKASEGHDAKSDAEFARQLSAQLNQKPVAKDIPDTQTDAEIARALAELLNQKPADKPKAKDAPASVPDAKSDAEFARRLEALNGKASAPDAAPAHFNLQAVHHNDEALARAVADQFALHKDPGTESDAEIAKSLEAQLNGHGHSRSSLEHKNLAEDEAMAATLQLLESEGSSSYSLNMLTQYKNVQRKRSSVPADEWKKIEAALQEILNSPAVIGEDLPAGSAFTDAHTYTKTLIRAGIPVLFDLDKQFKLSDETLTAEQVLKEVLAFIETISVEHSRISTNNIKATFARIPGEYAREASSAGETQADANHVLSRAWTLAKKLGPGYMGEIATCLSDNIGDAGGCIPGLIARLYAPYAQMVGRELGMAPNVKRDIAKKA